MNKQALIQESEILMGDLPVEASLDDVRQSEINKSTGLRRIYLFPTALSCKCPKLLEWMP